MAQPHSFSLLLDAGRPLSSGDSGQTGLLPSGVDSCQPAGLCPRLQCGRFLLAVMYSHHPSPGGLPPLISMPRLVTNCSSDCDCANSSGFRWPRSFILSIDSPLEGRNRNMRRSLTSAIPDPTKGDGLDGSWCVKFMFVWAAVSLRLPQTTSRSAKRNVINFRLYTLHSYCSHHLICLIPDWTGTVMGRLTKHLMFIFLGALGRPGSVEN